MHVRVARVATRLVIAASIPITGTGGLTLRRGTSKIIETTQHAGKIPTTAHSKGTVFPLRHAFGKVMALVKSIPMFTTMHVPAAINL
jgi:hypothetical protein